MCTPATSYFHQSVNWKYPQNRRRKVLITRMCCMKLFYNVWIQYNIYRDDILLKSKANFPTTYHSIDIKGQYKVQYF